MAASTETDTSSTAVVRSSTLDRFLPLWIGLAMAAGLLLGRWVPALNAVQLDGLSLPIALGLLLLMTPCWPRCVMTGSTPSPATIAPWSGRC